MVLGIQRGRCVRSREASGGEACARCLDSPTPPPGRAAVPTPEIAAFGCDVVEITRPVPRVAGALLISAWTGFGFLS